MSDGNAIIPGSLSALSQANNVSIAESFLSADVIIIVDVSGSMSASDSRSGRSRYETACEEWKLQANLRGKVAVVGFSDQVEFAPSGIPHLQGNGTDLVSALKFVQVADGLVRFIVVSDGCPNDEQAALTVARMFTSQIDTIFVGPEQDFNGGRAFLERLAKARGGKAVIAKCAEQLATKVEMLLLNGS